MKDIIREYIDDRIGKARYKKRNDSKVIVYECDDFFGYEASYKCIPNHVDNVHEYINNHLKLNQTGSEWYLFVSDIKVHGIHEVVELEYKDEHALEVMKSYCAVKDLLVASITIYDGKTFGVYQDDMLVGVCSLIEKGNYYDIAILVNPSYRKQKIGSSLLSEALKWIKTQNKIALYCVDEENVASRKLAESIGFKLGVKVSIYDKL